MFFQQIEVGQHWVFSYVVGDLESGEAFVVDPADDVESLIDIARSSGLTIQTIVNTHGHIDHVMGNAEMKQKTGAQIAIHESEADYLSKVGDYWLKMFRAERSPPADRLLCDGDILRVGSHSWRVIHTPGHSPGGICLYHERGLCITGDTLFVGSVGRTDGPRSSTERLIRSIRERLFTLPDETRVFPGHNYSDEPTSTIEHERRFNPFVNDPFTINLF